jgi:osmoprotectant transport system ATP-binding protein
MQQSRGTVQIDGVSKRFGEAQAVGPLDLTIRAGQTTVLIGPSGCGKSTLLRLIIGLIRPDSGSVHVDGAPVTPQTARTLRRRMGYVIQDGGLFPHLSARANVTLMARYLGWDRTRTDARLAELVGLTQFPEDGLERYPVQLSGGQRQRVGLMRALMLDPDVLLLDEPLGALDPMIRAELQADLRRICRTLAKTVVLVTHDLGEAGFFGDDVVLLRSGRIVQQGTLDDLLHAPADPFVTRFVNAQRSPLDAVRERAAIQENPA